VVPTVTAGSTATFTGGMSAVTLESIRGVPFHLWNSAAAPIQSRLQTRVRS